MTQVTAITYRTYRKKFEHEDGRLLDVQIEPGHGGAWQVIETTWGPAQPGARLHNGWYPDRPFQGREDGIWGVVPDEAAGLRGTDPNQFLEGTSTTLAPLGWRPAESKPRQDAG